MKINVALMALAAQFPLGLGMTTALASEPTTAPAASPMIVPAPSAARDLKFVPVTPKANTKPTKFKVDDDGQDCRPVDFNTVQAAVDAAGALAGPSLIVVCRGIYPENVVIPPGNNLTIEGKAGQIARIVGDKATDAPLVDIMGPGTVNLRRMVVNGQSQMPGSVVFGVSYDGARGVVQNVQIRNIRNADDTAQGVGLIVRSTKGDKAEVTVQLSKVEKYSRVAIVGDGENVRVRARRNKINGPLISTLWAPNGIQISRGARGNLDRNEVNNTNSPDSPAGAGSGIILYCPGAAFATFNTITGADLGISVTDAQDASVRRNRIRDSLFDAIGLQFIGDYYGPSRCPNAPVATTDNGIKRNTINGVRNDEPTGPSYGIHLVNFDTTNPTPPNNNRIESNDVLSSQTVGIQVSDGVDNVFRRNEIRNSGARDVVDTSTGTGTSGTANTWRLNQCVSTTPAGLCQ